MTKAEKLTDQYSRAIPSTRLMNAITDADLVDDIRDYERASAAHTIAHFAKRLYEDCGIDVIDHAGEYAYHLSRGQTAELDPRMNA